MAGPSFNSINNSNLGKAPARYNGPAPGGLQGFAANHGWAIPLAPLALAAGLASGPEIAAAPVIGGVAKFVGNHPIASGAIAAGTGAAIYGATRNGGGGGGTHPQNQGGANPNQAQQTYSPSGASGGSAGTTQASLTPDQQAYYNQYFDTQIGHLQQQLAGLGQGRDLSNLQLQQAYQGNLNDLQTTHDRGVRDLGIALDQLHQQRAQSLNDLARQVEQMGMSYNNQLGSFGAGNSSAAQLINQALAGQASRNRSDVLHNASNQEVSINNQQNDLETDFNTKKQQLDQWRQGKAAEILSNFNDQMQQLQEAIANAQGQKAQALAQYQPQVVQQAIDGLTQLQQVYNQSSQGLIDQYKSVASPNFAINPNLGQFQVNPVQAGRVSGVPNANPIAAPEFDPVAALLHRRDDQGNPLVPIGG